MSDNPYIEAWSGPKVAWPAAEYDNAHAIRQEPAY